MKFRRAIIESSRGKNTARGALEEILSRGFKPVLKNLEESKVEILSLRGELDIEHRFREMVPIDTFS